jgi:hypothetical protein
MDRKYGPKTRQFMKMIDSRHFRVQMSAINDEGIKSEIELLVSNNMEAAIATFQYPSYRGMPPQSITFRMVHREGIIYMINDTTRRIANMTATSPLVMIVGNAKFIGSGYASINGRNMFYEEYSVDSMFNFMGESRFLERVQYFVDENQLVGQMEFYRGENPTFTTIHALDQNVRMDVFDLPSGYREVSLEQLFF